MKSPNTHSRRFFSGQGAWVLLLFAAVVCAFIFYFPILQTSDALGIQDWDQNFAWSEFTRMSILRFGQFPFWDPYRCGGAAHFANPQIGVLSLQTVFVLIFGTVMGIKLSIFIHGVIGFIGCFLLARQFEVSRRGAVISSIIFSFSSITGSFLSTGMAVFVFFAYLPYIILLYNRGFDDRKWLIAAGGVMALSFYSGYHLPLMLLVYICSYTLVRVLYEKNRKAIYNLFIFVGTFILLSAPKLVLALELYSIFPSVNSDTSGYTFGNLFYFLLSRAQGLVNGDTVMWNIDEESLYVGVTPFFLSVVFFIRNSENVRKHTVLLLSLIVILVFMFGSNFPVPLYDWLHTFPVFSSFRIAQRFRFIFIILFAIIAGMGFDRLIKQVANARLSLALFLVVAGVIFSDLASLSSHSFFRLPLSIDHPVPQASPNFSQVGSYEDLNAFSYRVGAMPKNFAYTFGFMPRSLEYIAMRNNIGVIDCYDSVTAERFATGAESPFYRGEWFVENNRLTAALLSWSPNSISFAVEGTEAAPGSDVIVVNQNYYPGWYVEIDGALKRAVNHSGRLAAEITQRAGTVTFRFLPYKNIADSLFRL